MKPVYFDFQQGTPQWISARLGKPTGSRFDEIVTPTGKASTGKGRADYMLELLAERMTNCLTDHKASFSQQAAMERGTRLEPEARAWYSFSADREVKEVGFVECEEHRGKFGASPDGICADRGIEIKCPESTNMLRLLLADEKSAVNPYLLQIQAGMWLTGLPKWDLVIYTDAPWLCNRIITVEADAVIHAALEKYVLAFCEELDAAEKRLLEMGCRPILQGSRPLRDMMDEL